MQKEIPFLSFRMIIKLDQIINNLELKLDHM